MLKLVGVFGGVILGVLLIPMRETILASLRAAVRKINSWL